MQKRTLAVPAVLAAVALVVWWRGTRSDPAPASGGSADRGSGPAVDPARAGGERTAGEPATRPGEPARVRRLSVEERRRLGEQIAAARRSASARAAAAAASAAPSGGAAAPEDVIIPLEKVGKPLHDALEASIPFLAACFEQPGGAGPRTAAALMTMTSDPELGTVIDTGAIRDADGKSLGPKVDDCLRDAIDSLALPPLGEGGKLQLQYTFKLD